MKKLALLGIWGLCGLAALTAWVWMLLALIVGSTRAWKLAVSFDQTMNAATGGEEDETISSRAARGRDSGIWRWCVMCKLLDAIQPDHCNKSRGT